MQHLYDLIFIEYNVSCILYCRENSVEKLIKAMEELWETFLTSISSSVSDYLSIEHLGMILNRLAEQGNGQFSAYFLFRYFMCKIYCFLD